MCCFSRQCVVAVILLMFHQNEEKNSMDLNTGNQPSIGRDGFLCIVALKGHRWQTESKSIPSFFFLFLFFLFFAAVQTKRTIWHYTQVSKSHPEHRQFIQFVVCSEQSTKRVFQHRKKQCFRDCFQFQHKVQQCWSFSKFFSVLHSFQTPFLASKVMAQEVQPVSYTSSSKKSLLISIYSRVSLKV